MIMIMLIRTKQNGKKNIKQTTEKDSVGNALRTACWSWHECAANCTRATEVRHARTPISAQSKNGINFLAAPPARVGLLDTIYMQSNDSEPIPCCQVGQKLAKLSDFLNHLLAAKPTRSWQRGRKQCGCTWLTPAGASVLCLHFTICANFRFAIQFSLLINIINCLLYSLLQFTCTTLANAFWPFRSPSTLHGIRTPRPSAAPKCSAIWMGWTISICGPWKVSKTTTATTAIRYIRLARWFGLRYDATGNQPKLSEFESLPTSTGQESDPSLQPLQSASQQPHCDRQTRDDMNCQSAKSNESNNQVLKLQTDTHTHTDGATCACMHMHVVCG